MLERWIFDARYKTNFSLKAIYTIIKHTCNPSLQHREPGQTVCVHISIFVCVSIFIANVYDLQNGS